MKVQGWRALLAAGALAFGTTAVAAGGAQQQQGASMNPQDESQQGIGGSGQMGGQAGSTQGSQPAQQPPAQPPSQQQPPAQQGQMGQQAQAPQQGSLSGDVVEKRGDVFFVRLDQGAIIPVKVNAQTQATLSQKDGQLRGQQAVKKLNVGDKVNLEVRNERGSNIAQSIQLDQSNQGAQELQGKVASVQGNWVNLEHDSGALVPLKVDNQTQFQGQAQNQQPINSVRQLRPGQEVRASFRAEGTVNAAESIEVTGEGMGGSGQEGFEQQPEPQPMEPQPMEPPMDDGMGGSGSEGSGDFEGGMIEDPPLDNPSPDIEREMETQDPGTVY